MAECEFIEGCKFFKRIMAEKPATADMFKFNYCHGKYTKCARYLVRVKLGPDRVPEDLFPNMGERAEALINEED